MGYSFSPASSQYLQNASFPSLSMPLTISCWARYNTNPGSGNEYTIINISDTDSTNNFWELVFRGAAGSTCAARARNSADVTPTAATSGNISINTWHRITATFNATNSRSVFIGTTKSTNTSADAAPSGIDNISIAVKITSGGNSAYADMEICDVAVWDVALTDAEVAVLAKGFAANFVRPDSLIAYWPLVRELVSKYSSLTLTAYNTPTVVPNYPVLPKKRRFDSLFIADSGTSKSISDTGAGADATPSIIAEIPTTDSGTGTDLLSILNSLQVSDVGAGADADPLISLAIDILESGGGADQIAIAAALLLSDAGYGTDATPGIIVTLTITETGTGDDSPTIEVSFTVTDSSSANDAISLITGTLVNIADSGVGTEAISISAQLSIGDASTGTDSLSVTAQIPISDSGAGSDIISAAILIAILETGLGSDAISNISVAVGVGETGTGSEALGIEVSFTVADSGTGVDAAYLLGYAVTVIETGLGSDSISSVTVQAIVSETGQGSEAPLISASFSLSDTGQGVDQSSITAYIAAAETGTGTDIVSSISALVPILETGTGTDVIAQILAALTILDIGQGLDIIIKFEPGTEVAFLCFSWLSRSESFVYNRREEQMDFAQRSISLSFLEAPC